MRGARRLGIGRCSGCPKTLFAAATIGDTFPKEFAVYDVPELLKTLSLFDSPEVEYKDTHILISGGGRTVKYHYSSPSVVVAPPAKNPAEITTPLLRFTLTPEMIDKILRAATIMRLKELLLNGETKELLVYNKDNSGNEYRIELEDADGQGSAILSIANLKMLPDNYIVSVADKLVEFKSTSGNDLIYVIGREAEA